MYNIVRRAGAVSRAKSRVSPKNVKSRGNFLVGTWIVSMLVMSGCSTTQPMTKRIENQVSAIGKISDFQYYVSRNIILTKTEDPEIAGKVAGAGQMKVTSTKEVIQITNSTMGALLKTEKDPMGHTIYHVAFEADNDNCLHFVQKKGGNDERIYLSYDTVNNVINYGNAVYVVEWKGIKGLKSSKMQAGADNSLGKMKGFFKGVKSDDKDTPYLSIKMKTKLKEKEDYRKASGRKVKVR